MYLLDTNVVSELRKPRPHGAVLAWLDVTLIAQWLVFFGVTAFAFAYLRKYIGRQDDLPQPAVGANRWIGAEGVVLDAVDPATGAGMVRILNEEWRATAPGRGRMRGDQISFTASGRTYSGRVAGNRIEGLGTPAWSATKAGS